MYGGMKNLFPWNIILTYHRFIISSDDPSSKFYRAGFQEIPISMPGLITNLENTKVIRKYIVATTLSKFKCLNRVEINGYEEKIFPTWF